MWLTLRRTIRKTFILFLFWSLRLNDFRFIASDSIDSEWSILISDKIIPFFYFKLVWFIIAINLHHINWSIIVWYLWTTLDGLFSLCRYRFRLLFWLWLRLELKKRWTIITILFGEILKYILLWLLLYLFVWLLIFIFRNYTNLIIVVFRVFLNCFLWVNRHL